MNILPNIKTGISVCPHDCPSACALEVEVLDERTIGRVRGAKDNSYTLGVICEKVARYSERIHHPDRLLHPLKRKGPKGSGEFQRISWDDAMAETAEAMLKAEAEYGPTSVWPYFYAGTMGYVMRDGINRLRHAKGYSNMGDTFCVALSWSGYLAGTGSVSGVDPREMQKSDLIVIWGGNPVNTQVNVMTHAMKARKDRGAKIACIDIYETGTMKQADIKLLIRPGTDGALACAVMHVLFRDGYADWPYLEKYTDAPQEFAAHLKTKTPEWAAKICDIPVAEIEAFAKLIGETKRTFFRIGYGFTRSRNGAPNMHAVTCIPAVTGAWQHEGGGALHSNSGMYGMNKTMIEGLDLRKPGIRILDQSRIGAALLNDPYDLQGGPPVKVLFVQNTNPASVAPDQTKVKQGLAREDLFTCVHEQFMTETAKFADIVLPATMFLEHDDIYQGGGHSHLLYGRKLVEAPGECRSNHEVICDLARRVGAEHPGFHMSPRELIDWTLVNSKKPGLDTARCRELGGRDAGFRARPLPQGLRLPGWQVPLPRRLAKGALPVDGSAGRAGRHAAGLPRPLRDRSRRRRRSIPSGWPPARPAPSSIPPSTRRRRRGSARAGPPCSSTRKTWRSWASPTARRSRSAAPVARSRCMPRPMTASAAAC